MTIHPELRAVRLLPSVSPGPRLLALINRLPPRAADPGLEVETREVEFAASGSNPGTSARLLRPALATTPTAALLWVHGGGLITGSPEQDDRTNIAFVRSLGITVLAARYRLAPGARGPAAAEDVYSALVGLAARADELGIDPSRIAIGGASAGGGLAAAVAQMTHDRGGPALAFQLLVYPMLDDRTVVRPGIDSERYFVWTAKSNRYGWESYLGTEPGSASIPDYASPARRDDLSGLPPAWIGVGSLDMFRDEDAEYARRLAAAGVPCTYREVAGAFHGFDAIFRTKRVTREFWREQARALQAALSGR